MHVIEGGPVNAFTLPGGILVFYSHLIDEAKDSAQWRACWRTRSATPCTTIRSRAWRAQYGIDLLVSLLSGGYSDLLNTLGSAAACCWRCATAGPSSARPTPPA